MYNTVVTACLINTAPKGTDTASRATDTASDIQDCVFDCVNERPSDVSLSSMCEEWTTGEKGWLGALSMTLRPNMDPRMAPQHKSQNTSLQTPSTVHPTPGSQLERTRRQILL